MIPAVWWTKWGTRLHARVKVQGATQAGEQLFERPVPAQERHNHERAMVARLDRYVRGDRG